MTWPLAAVWIASVVTFGGIVVTALIVGRKKPRRPLNVSIDATIGGPDQHEAVRRLNECWAKIRNGEHE